MVGTSALALGIWQNAAWLLVHRCCGAYWSFGLAISSPLSGLLFVFGCKLDTRGTIECADEKKGPLYLFHEGYNMIAFLSQLMIVVEQFGSGLVRRGWMLFEYVGA